MDLAHLHLILNHLPIIGFPMLAVFLIWAHRRRDLVLRRFIHAMAIALAVASAGAFATGEPAEEKAEAAGVQEALIGRHEQAAEVAILFVWVTAGIALVSAFSVNRPGLDRVLAPVFALALVSTISVMAWTGYLGGQIRHNDGIATTLTTSDGHAADHDRD